MDKEFSKGISEIFNCSFYEANDLCLFFESQNINIDDYLGELLYSKHIDKNGLIKDFSKFTIFDNTLTFVSYKEFERLVENLNSYPYLKNLKIDLYKSDKITTSQLQEDIFNNEIIFENFVKKMSLKTYGFGNSPNIFFEGSKYYVFTNKDIAKNLDKRELALKEIDLKIEMFKDEIRKLEEERELYISKKL